MACQTGAGAAHPRAAGAVGAPSLTCPAHGCCEYARWQSSRLGGFGPVAPHVPSVMGTRGYSVPGGVGDMRYEGTAGGGGEPLTPGGGYYPQGGGAPPNAWSTVAAETDDDEADQINLAKAVRGGRGKGWGGVWGGAHRGRGDRLRGKL